MQCDKGFGSHKYPSVHLTFTSWVPGQKEENGHLQTQKAQFIRHFLYLYIIWLIVSTFYSSVFTILLQSFVRWTSVSLLNLCFCVSMHYNNYNVNLMKCYGHWRHWFLILPLISCKHVTRSRINCSNVRVYIRNALYQVLVTYSYLTLHSDQPPGASDNGVQYVFMLRLVLIWRCVILLFRF